MTSSAAPCSRRMYCWRTAPVPCSPVTVPPRATASRCNRSASPSAPRTAVGQAELGAIPLDRFDRTAVEQLGRGRKDPRGEEVVEREDRVVDARVRGQADRTRGRPRLHPEAEAGEDAERALRSHEELR